MRARIALPNRLLSQHTFTLSGTSTGSPPLALHESSNGPLVLNIGSQTVTTAALWWRGHAYRVPELAPGAQWQPDETSERVPSETTERILLARLPRQTSALLMPYTLADAGVVPARDTLAGWLLIRTRPLLVKRS